MPAQTPSEPTKVWTLEELIDFDYALESEANLGHLGKHDHRELFLRLVNEQQIENPEQLPRSQVFHYWLQDQRKRPPLSTARPGDAFAAGFRILQTALIGLGLISGFLLTASLLRYDGTQPTNVAGYLSILLGGQIALLVLAGLGLVARRVGLLRRDGGLIIPILRLSLSQIMAWVQRKAVEQSSAETRLRLTAFMGALGKKHSQYQSIVLGIISGLIQSFGVWFNLTAIVTTLLLVTISDRAFGWQTSLNLSPAQVHTATQTIALPWSSLYPNGVPTITEIEGSRIFLKDGIRTLANQDLVSWWPFLVCSLFVYGWLPRAILWGISRLYVKRRLAGMAFDSLNCDRLWEGMVTRELRTAGVPIAAKAPKKSSPEPPLTPRKEVKRPVDDRTALLLVEPDFAKRVSRAPTDAAVKASIGWEVAKWIRLPDETQSWAEFWEELEPVRKEPRFDRIVLIHEAFQPPIREILDWLRQLRATQSSNGKLMIYLVGRPEEPGQRRSVCETNQQVWEQSIAGLQDPNLAVQPLAPKDDAG